MNDIDEDMRTVLLSLSYFCLAALLCRGGDRIHDCIPVVKRWNSAAGRAEPFFPIAYYIESDMCYPGNSIPWGLVVAANVNAVCLSDMSPTYAECIGEALDAAEQHGLMMVLGINRHIMAATETEPESGWPVFKDYIRAYKDHPALLGWMMGDENELHEYITARATRRCAEAIRRLDPRHSVWQVFSGLNPEGANQKPAASDIRPYLPGTDVMITDQYFETKDRKRFEGSDATLYHVMHGAALASEQRLAWGVVIQGFGNDRIDGLNKWRFPEYEEFRWNVFSAIAGAGARALVPWLIPARPHVWLDDPEDVPRFLNKVVAPVYAELHEIRHAMETGYHVGRAEITYAGEAPRAWNKIFARVSFLLLHDDEMPCYFLILTNNDVREHHLRIRLFDLPVPLAGLEAAIPRSGRSLNLEDLGAGTYGLEDKIGHHQVTIYRLAAAADKDTRE